MIKIAMVIQDGKLLEDNFISEDVSFQDISLAVFRLEQIKQSLLETEFMEVEDDG